MIEARAHDSAGTLVAIATGALSAGHLIASNAPHVSAEGDIYATDP